MKIYFNKFYALVGFAFLAMTLPAHAHHGRPHHHFHHHHPHWHHQHGWVVPVIVGGVVTYEIMRRNRPVIVEREVVEVPPIPGDSRCSEWREIQNSNGQIYRERVCRSD